MNAKLSQAFEAVRFVAFDFDGVFTDNMVYVIEDGREAVRCNRGDGIGLSRLREIDIGTAIISTEVNPVVKARAKKLKISCVNGCDDKLGALTQMLDAAGLDLKQAAFVGNDINDLPCLEKVGLPIVVADAHESVISSAKYRTTKAGGLGAVREVCDMIADVQGAAQWRAGS